MTKKTEILDNPKNEIAAYIPFYSELAQLEKDNAALVFDYESSKGNKEARSHVWKLRQTKGALEKVRKEKKAEYLRMGGVVDSEAEAIKKRIEAMISTHQVKIDEIELRESSRVAEIRKRVENISSNCIFNTTFEVEEEIKRIESIIIDESYQEFMAEATSKKNASLLKNKELLSQYAKRDADLLELEKLRKEAADREQREKEKKIAEEAAERERKAAEERQKEAQRLAQKQQEESAMREKKLIVEAEEAKQKLAEAEKRAEQDRKDQAKREADAREKAIKDEQERIAKQQAKNAEDAIKRENDRKHAGNINRAAVTAMVENGMSEEEAKKSVILIAKGLIPNISIKY